MSITFRAAASGQGTTLTIPGSVTIGDFMVGAYMGVSGQSTPAGWTVLRTDTGVGTNSFSVNLYYKYAEAADVGGAATVSFGSSGGNHTQALYVATGGAAGTSVAINAQAANVSAVNGTALTAPSVTTTGSVADFLIVQIWGLEAAASGTPALTVPSTSRTNSGAGTFSAGAVTEQATSSIGATGTQTATASATGAWVAVTLALVSVPTPATLALRGVNIVQGISGTTATVAVPGQAISGDVMLLITSRLASETITTPTGWTPIREDTGVGTNNTSVKSFWMVVQPSGANSPGATVTVTFSGTNIHNLIISVWSSADSSTPIHAQGATVSAGIGTTATAPSVTTTLDGCQIIENWGSYGTGSSIITAPATVRAHSTANNGGIATSDQSQAVHGATGSLTATASSSGSWVGQTLALAPIITVSGALVGGAILAGTPTATGRLNGGGVLSGVPTATGGLVGGGTLHGDGLMLALLNGGAVLSGAGTPILPGVGPLQGGVLLGGVPNLRSTAVGTRVRTSSAVPNLVAPKAATGRRRRVGVAQPAPLPVGSRHRSGRAVPVLNRHLVVTGTRVRGGYCVVVRTW